MLHPWISTLSKRTGSLLRDPFTSTPATIDDEHEAPQQFETSTEVRIVFVRLLIATPFSPKLKTLTLVQTKEYTPSSFVEMPCFAQGPIKVDPSTVQTSASKIQRPNPCAHSRIQPRTVKEPAACRIQQAPPSCQAWPMSPPKQCIAISFASCRK